ncbi:MAG: aldehyde dehydrogenase family protein [Candidatus Eisenbacteria bacterium]|nr:aldehyde dehydrogenase family protein [Candidatus Eisenbacteria bacterium]
MEYKNFINGKWVGARSGEKFENRNPADWDELVGVFPKSGAAEVDEAVEAAEQAFRRWRLVPAPKRAEIIYRAGELLRKHKEEIARDMTREMGKVIQETRGDTQEGIDTAYYAAGEGRRMFGETTPAELPDKFAMSVRQPIGVCGIISPWNFPMAIPTWKIFPALVCGNTVVFKPASDTPLTGVNLVRTLAEAGLPAGVINLVHGTGSGVGNPLVQHPKVRLVSFTGSSRAGRQIAEFCGKTLKRVSLELGGKNAQIVMEDADIDLAVEGALWGAFGTTGQRCTATSRIVLHEKIREEFLASLVARVKKLRLGNGLDPNVDVGPLINEGQREQIQSYVEIGLKEGAKLMTGGKPCEQGDCKKGWFYEPTVFAEVEQNMRIAQEEIFGPVVSVITARDFTDAISILNNSSYGLSSSIYTNDVRRALVAIRDIEAGITYVNGPTIGAEVHLPFGGVKDTGNGHRESGTAVLDVFSEWKSVYIDYSGKLQKAQIDDVRVE